MNTRPFIRRAWIAGILLPGLLWFLLRPGHGPNPAGPPGPTPEETNQRAAPALHKMRRNLRKSPLPDRPGGPAIQLRSGILAAPRSAPSPVMPVHSRPSSRGYPWMVLFDGPIQPEWRRAIEQAGAVIRAYLPVNALLAEVPPESLARMADLPHVAWSGEYRPAHKVQPLLSAMSREQPGLLLPVTIQSFAPADTELLQQELRALGAADIRAAPGKRWGLLRAILPAQTAVELARLPEVQWVEHHEPPRLLNDLAASGPRLNVDAVRDNHGLVGTGQIVAIADTGLDTGDTNTLHPDFAGRLLQVFDTGRLTNWSDTYYHGTHVAGSVLGAGAASGGQYRGMAPGARLVLQSIMTAAETLALPTDLNDFYAPPYGVGARIHSDSWGSPVGGTYTSDAMTTDEYVWDHPDLLVLFSAGNSGIDNDLDGIVDPGSLGSPASAKNVLAVGASESGRPAGSGGLTSRSYRSAWYSKYPAPPIGPDLVSSSPAGEPQGMAAFSSRGPAADGRTKPDIVAPGTDIVSARSRASTDTGWGVLAGNTNYCFQGGTSMATPLAAGGAALVRQYCTDRLGMDPPSAALLKAALVGGARPLTPGQYGTNEYREIPAAPRPNNVDGWGQADIGNTLFPSNGTQAVLMEGATALETGDRDTLAFTVHSPAPLALALAYSDYPSALAAALNLVNDLDLTLAAPDGSILHPNGLTGPDDLNNVEVIDIPLAQTGTWTLAVSAANVPQGPQPYALYLRGAVYMPVTIAHEPLVNSIETSAAYRVSADVTSPSPFDPGTVKLVWIATGSTGGFTTTAMATTNGTRFEADIPAQPVGSRIWYYLTAGPPEVPAYHPANAPVELHQFDITPPVVLAVAGSPAFLQSAEPPYGHHEMASNIAVQARAVYSPLGSNGWRTACIGWTGTGSVPPSGALDSCEFTITQNSVLRWLWQEQVALTQLSSPYGALTAATWHETGTTAASLTAPESHNFNNEPLTFAGWQVDGARYPAAPAPSLHQIGAIPMDAPRTATAVYLGTDLDEDANGLPDWFELRYYGQTGQDRYADTDGDGFEDELEAADHTDPLDAASFPAPPVIQHVPLASPAVTPAPWPVTAIITDNYQMASATLHWQRNGGIPRSTAMSNPPGSTLQYSATIPSPARDGDIVVYHLSALDSAGFSAQSAIWTVKVSYARITTLPGFMEAAAPAGARTNRDLFIWNTGSGPLEITLETAPVGFADDIETGTNGWTRPDGNSVWHISSQEAFSPSNAWYCGQESSRLYPDSTHAALVTPPIRLGAGSPRLDFMHWARFEPDVSRFPDGIHYWDSGILEITGDAGLTWHSLVPEGGYPGLITSNPASPFAPDTPCFVDTDDWEPVGVDLSPYAGREVQIRFRFGADAYVTAEGWRIDDVVVSPCSQYDGWLTLPATNATVPAGLGSIFPMALDTTPLPPMGSGHRMIRIHHNDPESATPIDLPVALYNTTRRVRIAARGRGQAVPGGETLVQVGESFSVAFTADPGHFIADLQTNGIIVPLPEVTSTQSLHWALLDGNLDIEAVFAPQLEDGLIPPEWLDLYGLTSRNWMAEASLDQDGDGFLTWQEEQLNSSPIDPEDAPLIVNLLAPTPPATDWRLVWHAFTNHNATYEVRSSPDLISGFSAVTNLPAAPPVMTSPPLLPDHRFFGIRKD